MVKTRIVTLFVIQILCLIGGLLSPLEASALTYVQNVGDKKVTVSADQLSKEEKSISEFSLSAYISRSTSLYDFQDGTRKEGMDYLIIPSYTVAFGSFSSMISYSQDLKDTSPGGADWNDISMTFSFKSMKWEWSPPYILTLTPTLTGLLPISQASVKRDQLQTAFSTGISFGIIPDGIATTKEGTWNLILGLTAGRAIHLYEEDINGKVLNKYSSNQFIILGYKYKRASVSIKYFHKTLWTYQNNVKDFFDLSQIFEYSINDYFSIALGHSNAGSGLKTNATESNFSLVNDNNSSLFVQLGASY